MSIVPFNMGSKMLTMSNKLKEERKRAGTKFTQQAMDRTEVMAWLTTICTAYNRYYGLVECGAVEHWYLWSKQWLLRNCSRIRYTGKCTLSNRQDKPMWCWPCYLYHNPASIRRAYTLSFHMPYPSTFPDPTTKLANACNMGLWEEGR